MKQIPGGVTAPKGFRAWGVHCGVKSKKADKKDLALILSDQECAAAAVATLIITFTGDLHKLWRGTGAGPSRQRQRINPVYRQITTGLNSMTAPKPTQKEEEHVYEGTEEDSPKLYDILADWLKGSNARTHLNPKRRRRNENKK